MVEIVLDYAPTEKQKKLHTACVRQILYGGAAGGGKSHALRWDLYTLCLNNPGCQAYLFRKTLTELEDNHIKFLKTELPSELGVYHESKKRFDFSNGSALWMCFCERPSDARRYLGAELHVCGLDEASQMHPESIGFLKTRSRIGGWKPSPEYKNAFPRFIMASNPGGAAHSLLKRTFIDPAAPETVFYDKRMSDPRDPKDKGWSTIYLPAKMEDNPHLDSDYGASFGGIPPELARAYREGDWDAVVGQALETLSRDKHLIRDFDIPKHWTKFMSIDWGSAKPFSVGWFAVSDGALIKGKGGRSDVYLPPGSVVLYREWYGWTGEEDQGCGMDARTVSKEIVRIEKEANDVMDYRIADSAMWARSDGPSVAENMMDATDGKIVMRGAKKDREANYAEARCRLAGASNYMETGEEGDWPMFFATDSCEHFWRTVPSLTLDQTNPEKGPDSHLEDHVYDMWVYALRSRPFKLTEKDRFWTEHGRDIKKARGKHGDPYATR